MRRPRYSLPHPSFPAQSIPLPSLLHDALRRLPKANSLLETTTATMKASTVAVVLAPAAAVNAQWWGGAPDCAVSRHSGPIRALLLTMSCSNPASPRHGALSLPGPRPPATARAPRPLPSLRASTRPARRLPQPSHRTARSTLPCAPGGPLAAVPAPPASTPSPLPPLPAAGMAPVAALAALAALPAAAHGVVITPPRRGLAVFTL